MSLESPKGVSWLYNSVACVSLVKIKTETPFRSHLSTTVNSKSDMRLTFVTDIGQSYVIEVDPQMELENIMALLEAEASGAGQSETLS